MAGAQAHESHAVAVLGVHVGLHLEDEAGHFVFRRLDGALAWAEVAVLAGVFFLAAATLSASTYNPFIYFRF